MRTMFRSRRHIIWVVVPAALACLPIGSLAQSARPNPTATLNETVAAFRASPLYRLARIRPKGLPPAGSTFRDAVQWLNREILAGMPSNAPVIRIEARPLQIAQPPCAPELLPAVTSQVARLRAADDTWCAEIASNSLRRVTVEGNGLSVLDILKDCCTQADMQYADDGGNIVAGNVYFLRWPPAIAGRVFSISAKLMKELGEGVKDVVAPAPFHDGRRDWMTLVPEHNALIVFHHPEMLDTMAATVQYANANADAIIQRRQPLRRPGKPMGDGK